MYKELQELKKKVDELTKTVQEQSQRIKQLSETSYKTGKREIINREIQFLQKVYDKDNNLVTEINP